MVVKTAQLLPTPTGAVFFAVAGARVVSGAVAGAATMAPTMASPRARGAEFASQLRLSTHLHATRVAHVRRAASLTAAVAVAPYRLRSPSLVGQLALAVGQLGAGRLQGAQLDAALRIFLDAVPELRDFARIAARIRLNAPLLGLTPRLPVVAARLSSPAVAASPPAALLSVGQGLASRAVPITIAQLRVLIEEVQEDDMLELDLAPVEVSLRFSRGNNPAFSFQFLNEQGTPLDITGNSYQMTVGTLAEPPDGTTNLFSLVGAVPTGADGRVEFQASVGQMDIVGVFFYDVQQVNTRGAKRTVLRGQMDVEQGVTKA